MADDLADDTLLRVREELAAMPPGGGDMVSARLVDTTLALLCDDVALWAYGKPALPVRTKDVPSLLIGPHAVSGGVDALRLPLQVQLARVIRETSLVFVPLMGAGGRHWALLVRMPPAGTWFLYQGEGNVPLSASSMEHLTAVLDGEPAAVTPMRLAQNTTGLTVVALAAAIIESGTRFVPAPDLAAAVQARLLALVKRAIAADADHADAMERAVREFDTGEVSARGYIIALRIELARVMADALAVVGPTSAAAHWLLLTYVSGPTTAIYNRTVTPYALAKWAALRRVLAGLPTPRQVDVLSTLVLRPLLVSQGVALVTGTDGRQRKQSSLWVKTQIASLAAALATLKDRAARTPAQARTAWREASAVTA